MTPLTIESGAVFLSSTFCAILRTMAIWSVLSRLLMILAVVGLVTGAFAGPGAAGPMSGMSIAMSDGEMPPCEQPAPADCGDMKACPFAVVCVAKYPQNVPTAASILRCPSMAAAARPRDDAQGSSITLVPLGHPPKA